MVFHSLSLSVVCVMSCCVPMVSVVTWMVVLLPLAHALWWIVDGGSGAPSYAKAALLPIARLVDAERPDQWPTAPFVPVITLRELGLERRAIGTLVFTLRNDPRRAWVDWIVVHPPPLASLAALERLMEMLAFAEGRLLECTWLIPWVAKPVAGGPNFPLPKWNAAVAERVNLWIEDSDVGVITTSETTLWSVWMSTNRTELLLQSGQWPWSHLTGWIVSGDAANVVASNQTWVAETVPVESPHESMAGWRWIGMVLDMDDLGNQADRGSGAPAVGLAIRGAGVRAVPMQLTDAVPSGMPLGLGGWRDQPSCYWLHPTMPASYAWAAKPAAGAPEPRLHPTSPASHAWMVDATQWEEWLAVGPHKHNKTTTGWFWAAWIDMAYAEPDCIVSVRVGDWPQAYELTCSHLHVLTPHSNRIWSQRQHPL